jgi:hypothetical protein
MKWSVVVELSVPGLAIGLAVVFGMGEAAMWVLWALLRLATALWIARWVRRKHFAHGFWAGFLGAAAAVLCGAVLFETYTGHHPEYLERAGQIPNFDPRILLVVIALAVGVVHGIVQGGLAWIASKIVTSR